MSAKRKTIPTLRERLIALKATADTLYGEMAELLPAYAEEIRHSNVPGGVYVTAWRARGLGDARVIIDEALRDGEN